MKRFLFACFLLGSLISVQAQVPVTNISLGYFQNFNSLSDTTLSNAYSTLPAHWQAMEFGSNADQTYRAAYGEFGGGDLYSFGDSAVVERALGSIGSGSNTTVLFGASFVNQTTDTITAVVVQYMGEQWRQGRPAAQRSTGPDTLHFAYAVNPTTIDDGTFIKYTNLNFASPSITALLNVPLNGNNSLNQTYKKDTIFGLSLAPSDTFFIRWSDYNSSSFDDGLGVDSLTVNFIPKAAAPRLSYLFIGQSGQQHYEDFNQLSNNYTSGYANFSTLPAGWYAQEVGSNADSTYRVSYGEFASGEIYSFGDSSSTERALGSIGSGSNSNLFYGAAFINNTGDSLRSMTVNYVGEQWRQGRPGSARATGPDTIFFGYALNPTSLGTASFTEVADLHFASAENNGVLGTPLNGNDIANQTQIDFTVHNLKIANGDTVWIRWRDFNSSSFDDGLAIDSLTVTFFDTTNTGGSGNPITASRFLSINQFNSSYLQTFDSLGADYANSPYNHNTLPKGWFASEEGSNSDNTFNVAYGEFASGNIYSFGDSLSSERALGSIGSGANSHSDYGAAFINNTGDTITTLEVDYVGEQWRQGRPGVSRSTGPDTLHFSVGINVASIAASGFNAISDLNFYSPEVNGTLNTPLNGNDTVNQTKLQYVVVNLNVLPRDTVWLRWTDFNSQSFDDGLGIDSVKVTALKNFQSTAIAFSLPTQTFVEVDGVIDIPLKLTNSNGFSSQVEVFMANTGTVDLASDLSFVSTNTIFQAGDTTANFKVLLNREQPFENKEYLVLGLRNLGNAQAGAIAFDTIYIENYVYPAVAIDKLKSSNNQGVADSLNGRYLLTGVVHGINYSTSGGTDFYLLQNGNGINVYAPNSALNYSVNEGDNVSIWGQLSQFRGLSRIESIDSIQVNATNAALETSTVVNTLNEATESNLVTLSNITLYPPISNFPSDLAVTALTTTNDTVSIFVSSQSNLAGTPTPVIPFTLTGLGSQFANYTAPFTGGYRLMVISKANSNIGLAENMLTNVSVFPNPFSTHVNVLAKEAITKVEVFNISGKQLRTQRASAKAVNVNLTDLSSGTYVLRVHTANSFSNYKIVK